jgi:hypothetical protein
MKSSIPAFLVFLAFGFQSLPGHTAVDAKGWTAAEGPLATRWAAEVDPLRVLPEYPRPQLVREAWLNLNGLWDFAMTPRDATRPDEFPEQILVPFPVESALSGVMRNVTENDRLWYRRTFEVPPDWNEQRVLLHFGAVDFETVVWINGREVGQHRGGYSPFHFDVTAELRVGGSNELIVAVWDPTDAGTQPRGKQVRKPDRGIFYTAASGIWQTVWIEPVPATHVRRLALVPDIDANRMLIRTEVAGARPDTRVEVEVTANGRRVARATGGHGEELALSIRRPRLWSPEDPFLYDLRVTVRQGRHSIETVSSYFGMRKIALGQDEAGVTRIFMNNKPYFMLGFLDQGYWPDGIYTAPTDDALRFDIEITRQLGFNMARKHVKIEPARWYYWADRLGLIVWQDMPSGDRSIGSNDPDLVRTPESAAQFEVELQAMIEAFRNHPSIVLWVIFNEGWGQYDTARLTDWVKETDPTRLVISASGWTDRGTGDAHDIHAYPGPASPPPEPRRAAVLGEFGGLGLKVDGHTWADQTWGYRGMGTAERLARQYMRLLARVYELKETPGLSAAVYTQTTDVEYEGNGLLTYDRAVVKIDPKLLREINLGRVPAPPAPITVVPSAQDQAIFWRYTTEQPADGWFESDFDDSSWTEGPAGFGTRGTPGAIVRTEWNTSRIWIRRTFELPADRPSPLALWMHHDEDAEVYLNGVLAARTTGYTSEYADFEITPEARATLTPGRNVIAIHCRQTVGGQYIDAGLVHLPPID